MTIIRFLIVFCSISLSLFSQVNGQVPAFPEAFGGGKYATGGRGGSVYFVTNLNDSGSGSLRDAISQPNRTVIFKVSGVINLKSKLSFRNSNITVAGQTAPGAGICITGYPVNISASNIIIRYLRFRLGDQNKVEDDALNCFKGAYTNILIDHCSMSWSIDETTSFYDVKNITVQNCIISESLYNSYHTKGEHGYGGIFGGNTSSYFFNLIAHHTSRNPRFNGTRYNDQTFGDSLEFSNNVIFNWGGNSIYGGEGGKYNIVNNYFKAGPATSGNLTNSSSSNKRNRILNYTSYYLEGKDTIWGGKFYVNGNYVHGYPDVTADNWTKGVQKDSYPGAVELMKLGKADQQFGISNYVAVSPQDAYNEVIKHAGASLPQRDTIDARIIRELMTGTATYGGSYASGVSKPNGIIDSPSDVGGLPAYLSTTAPQDMDGDGIPDEWETQNGLNPNQKTDGNAIGAEGYTHLEEYLNGLTKLGTTSVKEINTYDLFEIFPMPIIDVVNMEFKTNDRPHSIEVFDALGKKVLSISRGNMGIGNAISIDVKHLERGIYFLNMISLNAKMQTKKIMIM